MAAGGFVGEQDGGELIGGQRGVFIEERGEDIVPRAKAVRDLNQGVSSDGTGSRRRTQYDDRAGSPGREFPYWEVSGQVVGGHGGS
jgi:hypothetical protein